MERIKKSIRDVPTYELEDCTLKNLNSIGSLLARDAKDLQRICKPYPFIVEWQMDYAELRQ